MPDVFTAAKRSEIMSRVKSRGNKATEIAFVNLLRSKKITGWRRHPPMIGNPDFVFRAQRLTVFIDGCYWHGCPRHYSPPKSNAGFWAEKLKRNRRRDRYVAAALTNRGWRVVRFWQHDFATPEKILKKLASEGIRGKLKLR
jgi:DNA mismatch endonuclease, patch repair protein